MNEKLDGGREEIYKTGNIVYRPSENWTNSIHEFLIYLHSTGFNKVPLPFGIDEDGQEKVSFLEGDVYNELLPEEVRSDTALISFCQLIKEFHDLGAEYVGKLTGNERWMLDTNTPIETMCHGDLAPYNIVMKGTKAIGIIDFDALHPGSRMWDIAYSLYRWIPLLANDNPENFGSQEDKNRRLGLFLTTYGMKNVNTSEVMKWVIKRLEYLLQFMKNEAANGNEVFKEHIEEGHLEQYFKDIDYIRLNWVHG